MGKSYNIDDPFKEIRSRKSRPLASASADAKRMHRWELQRHFRQHLPLAIDCVIALEMGYLRFLASQFRAFDGELAREWQRDDYVKFILGHQRDPTNLIPADPIPYGDLPELKKSEGLGH